MFVSDKQWAWSPLPHCFITDVGVTLLCWERETRQIGLFVLEFFIYLIIYYLYIISVYLIIVIVLFPTLCFPSMMLSELCLEWKICVCLDLQSHITFCLLFSLSFFAVLNALFAFLTSTECWADFSRAVISNWWPVTACVCFRLFFFHHVEFNDTFLSIFCIYSGSNMRELMWSFLVCYRMLFSMLSNETWRTCFRTENKIWDFIVLKKSGEVVKIKHRWTTKRTEIKEDLLETVGWAGFLNEERYWSWKERYWSWKEWLTNLGHQWRKQEWHEWNCVAGRKVEHEMAWLPHSFKVETFFFLNLVHQIICVHFSKWSVNETSKNCHF